MTSPILRPYQRRDADVMLAGLHRSAPSQLYVLPTRGGKTVVVAEVIRQVVTAGWEVVLFAHRREIVRQAANKLGDLGIPHGVIEPGATWTSHPVHVASIDTLRARLHEPETRVRLARVRLLVPDEAHHVVADSWLAVIEAAVAAALLGLTATPYRLDGKGLGDTFAQVVRGPTIRELIADGYLVQPRTFAPLVPDLSGVGKVAGEFNRRAAAEAMDTPAVIRQCLIHYARLAPGQPSVWFWPTVEAAHLAAERFRAAGWRSACVEGSMSTAERDAAIGGLHDRRVQALHSVEIISEGVDLPHVAVAGLCRPTASTCLYMQQGGRVLTPAEGKGGCTILDMVGNWARHGLVDQDRPWDLHAGIKGLERSVLPIRRCGACHFIAEQGPATCPNCGRRYPNTGALTDQLLAQMPGVRGVSALRLAAMGHREVVDFARTLDFEEVVTMGRARGLTAARAKAWAANICNDAQGRVA